MISRAGGHPPRGGLGGARHVAAGWPRTLLMCRWLAYTGSPVLLTDVLYTPVHSLIDQSLHSRLGAETTNGDGFGIGWY